MDQWEFSLNVVWTMSILRLIRRLFHLFVCLLPVCLKYWFRPRAVNDVELKIELKKIIFSEMIQMILQLNKENAISSASV